MSTTYSTYEAKAKFSELIRKVRAGQRVIISYRGENIAEIRPLERKDSLDARLQTHEERGTVGGAPRRSAELRRLVKRRGALRRFLESRD